MMEWGIFEGFGTCELFTALSEQEVKGLIALWDGSCNISACQTGDTIFVQGGLNTFTHVVLES